MPRAAIFMTDDRPAAARNVVAMQALAVDSWDRTVAAFDDVCQEQLVAFARARWPGVTLEPQLFVEDGRIVGGALVMIQPLPLRLGAIAVVKWAPIQRFRELPGAGQRYAAMIAALVDEYDGRRGMMLSVLPRASLEPDNPEFTHLMRTGFRRGARLLFPNRYLVRLRLSDDEQRASLQQKWRYHLHRAEAANLQFERALPGEHERFTTLYEQMLDRKRFPDHSAFETVAELMAMPDERLRPELFFVRHGDELVAGAIIFKAGQRAVYLYGATSAAALELRAGYFLHWHIIRWLRDHTQADWYDLGGTDGFQGLHQFKKGMVGTRGVVTPVPPVANYASRALPRLIGETAFAAREAVHAVRRRVDLLRPDRAKPDQRAHGSR